MTINHDSLTDRMAAVANYDYNTSVRLMLRCLAVIPVKLPPVAISSFEVASRYWIDRTVPKAELEKARIDCWNYLDERAVSTNTIDPEPSAVRAVICVLYDAPPSDDVAELLEFFNQVLIASFGKQADELSCKVSSIVEEFDKAM